MAVGTYERTNSVKLAFAGHAEGEDIEMLVVC
jgi:hypothetical protein